MFWYSNLLFPLILLEWVDIIIRIRLFVGKHSKSATVNLVEHFDKSIIKGIRGICSTTSGIALSLRRSFGCSCMTSVFNLSSAASSPVFALPALGPVDEGLSMADTKLATALSDKSRARLLMIAQMKLLWAWRVFGFALRKRSTRLENSCWFNWPARTLLAVTSLHCGRQDGAGGRVPTD